MEENKNIPETAEEAVNQEKKEKKAHKQDKKLLAEIEELKAKIAESDDKYLRMAAEYDNFRRRSREEKDAIYETAMPIIKKESFCYALSTVDFDSLSASNNDQEESWSLLLRLENEEISASGVGLSDGAKNLVALIENCAPNYFEKE